MNEICGRAHRKNDQLRTITYTRNSFGYASASVLFELGGTKVLCCVTMQQGVPPFLKGSKTGWLTAEYAMLPNSTHTRLTRETVAKRNDRAIEISRLIGRVLRTVVNLNVLGERTIFVDCDVLQADGGTRTAAITGASIALQEAVEKWLATGIIQESILKDAVGAISVGLMNGQPLLDLDYQEDSDIDADYNFVFTKSGDIIEIQGTAEKFPITSEQFDSLKGLAVFGAKKLFHIIDQIQAPHKKNLNQIEKAPLFSLKNRLQKTI